MIPCVSVNIIKGKVMSCFEEDSIYASANTVKPIDMAGSIMPVCFVVESAFSSSTMYFVKGGRWKVGYSGVRTLFPEMNAYMLTSKPKSAWFSTNHVVVGSTPTDSTVA
ncbi:hypothetical protein C5167_033250 [Papaver somniferum]|uniref:Uncharacterized protein n=1 Tax=Papaver somniferum TaxID=3469 RepID=A0A4Y7KD89_PAPSO|nr:hypothetical protein C5167_033250 [Papaver somniferum]